MTSTAKITITEDEWECALFIFELAPETWDKTEKGNAIRFLEKQIPQGTKK